MESYLDWLQGLPISIWINESESLWGYPLVLFLHSVGMALSAGLAMVIDLRLCGLGRPLPISSLRKLFPIFWGGFVVNAASGSLLFMAAAASTGYVPMYYAKLTMVLFGLLAMRPIRAFVDGDGADADIPTRVKALAAASFLLWTGVIATGRLIAYVK